MNQTLPKDKTISCFVITKCVSNSTLSLIYEKNDTIKT